MLQIDIPITHEGWDEIKEEFIPPKMQTLKLEHSLVSLSKWESKWCKPFLFNAKLTDEEVLDYIKCMTITQNVDPDVYNYLTVKNINSIIDYINAPMTATTFVNAESSTKKKEIVTSELIYYWMITWNIPFECQKWHINRLLTLIRVCSVKNTPAKQMSKAEIARLYAEQNAVRKKQLNTRG